MSDIPTRQEQIVQSHAGIIVSVVHAVNQPELQQELEATLKATEDNGWTDLVRVIRRILKGERETSLLNGLDEEDTTIIEAILQGIQNPETLPDPTVQADPTIAAPGLASMIHDATRGHVEALELVANMAEHMTSVGGDFGKLGSKIRLLVEGERNADKLSEGMSAQGRSLMLLILEELGKLEAH